MMLVLSLVALFCLFILAGGVAASLYGAKNGMKDPEGFAIGAFALVILILMCFAAGFQEIAKALR